MIRDRFKIVSRTVVEGLDGSSTARIAAAQVVDPVTGRLDPDCVFEMRLGAEAVHRQLTPGTGLVLAVMTEQEAAGLGLLHGVQ